MLCGLAALQGALLPAMRCPGTDVGHSDPGEDRRTHRERERERERRACGQRAAPHAGASQLPCEAGRADDDAVLECFSWTNEGGIRPAAVPSPANAHTVLLTPRRRCCCSVAEPDEAPNTAVCCPWVVPSGQR
eukprot:3393990-Rhodomonas_salina.3